MDLIQYVASLPSVKITRLYENRFTCLAIFRSLSPLAKQYIYRMVFLDDPIPECELILLVSVLFSKDEIIADYIVDQI